MQVVSGAAQDVGGGGGGGGGGGREGEGGEGGQGEGGKAEGTQEFITVVVPMQGAHNCVYICLVTV